MKTLRMMYSDNVCSSCVTFGLMAAALGPMIVLTNDVPDRIPADVLAEEQQAAIDGKKVDPQALPTV